ncbi:ABC transporter permease [Nitrincola sp. MINF-07-Sa-05]|uniref:ABC transporter permease n=1 Tax=Nitrincola salilacus TaxID=3400273 RepID=UPI0039181C58
MIVEQHSTRRNAPFAALRRAWQFRELISGMAKREVLGRYKGSWLGLVWTLLTPLLLLLVYMFVFGVIFQARWPQSEGVDGNFAALLFCGIIAFFMFSEVLTRSPRLIVDNANYVKKVVFPLDALIWVAVATALFHFLISFVVLLGFVLVSGVGVSVYLLYFPVITGLLVVFLLGLSWFLSALGVYIRDVSYIAGFLSTALLFLSPVFYPASAVPESFRILMDLNPLTFYIEAFRSVAVLKQAPDYMSMLLATAVSLGVFALGYWFFQRVRKGFADVL